jgi:hypothetical protein
MKKFVLLAVACLTGATAFSQSFMHAVGLSVFIDHTPRSGSITSVALTYSPRFNLMENKNMSVSVGIPLSIGGSGGRGGRQGDGYYIDDVYYYYDDNGYEAPEVKARWMIDVPVIVNLNFGALSTKHNTSRIGFFVGGGFGYHYGPVNVFNLALRGNNYVDSTNQNLAGPVGNIGMRIRVSKYSNEGIEIKGSYMKSVSRKQPDIYGITVMYAF